jgi:hypothetical protein
VPIGAVDLEIGTHRGTGTLSPLAGYEAIAPILRAAADLEAAARSMLLILPAEATPSSPALQAAAALTFELWDEQGVYVPATTVRLVELATRPGVTVFAEFGEASAAVPARARRRPPDGGGEAILADG